MAYVETVPYADVEYADAYFAERVGSDAWDALAQEHDEEEEDPGDAAKEKALKHATRLIDRCQFIGEKTDEDQARQFPREDDTEVPDCVMQACCEVALELVKGNLPEDAMQRLGVTSEGIGDASASYGADGATAALGTASGLPSIAAAQLLAEWLADPTEIRNVRVD